MMEDGTDVSRWVPSWESETSCSTVTSLLSFVSWSPLASQAERFLTTSESCQVPGGGGHSVQFARGRVDSLGIEDKAETGQDKGCLRAFEYVLLLHTLVRIRPSSCVLTVHLGLLDWPAPRFTFAVWFDWKAGPRAEDLEKVDVPHEPERPPSSYLAWLPCACPPRLELRFSFQHVFNKIRQKRQLARSPLGFVPRKDSETLTRIYTHQRITHTSGRLEGLEFN